MELWEPKQRIERMYRRSLQEIAKQIILRIGDSTDIEAIKKTLHYVMKSNEFKKYAEASATKMATHLFADVGKTWRQAAKENGKGREIYEALQKELKGKTGKILAAQIKRNADLIKSLPDDIAEDLTGYIAKETFKGRRAADIAEEIKRKFPAQTKARADLIARTEVSKTQSGLTEARCRQFGIDWYIWRACGGSSGDGRTRKSHRAMSGVIVAWDDPPAPESLFPITGPTGKRYKNSLGNYHAGCCPNCRCYAVPVIDIDFMDWPARVYRGGRIQTVSKKAFKKIAKK